MREGKVRLSRAACGVAVALSFCAVACGAQPSSGEVGPSSFGASETPADSDAVRAAEATVQAFFAVKGQAENPISVRIDEQAVYLTSRGVHPGAAYEKSMDDRPSGITDSEVTVELSNARWLDDDIQIDFEFDSTGVSYPTIGNRMQLDKGTPQRSHWDGTATLEKRNGAWLIDDLSVDSFGGGIG
jgi:hypothetical protein